VIVILGVKIPHKNGEKEANPRTDDCEQRICNVAIGVPHVIECVQTKACRQKDVDTVKPQNRCIADEKIVEFANSSPQPSVLSVLSKNHH
jgi:hypothetical protein